MLSYPINRRADYTYKLYLKSFRYKQDKDDSSNNSIKAQLFSTALINEGQALSTKILKDSIDKNGNFIANTIDKNFENFSKSLDSVNTGLSNIDNTLDRGFNTLNRNISYLEDNLNRGLNKVSSNISTLNKNIHQGFKSLSSDIRKFHSDFNIAMGGIALQLSMQRREMKEALNSIIDILKNRRKTEAIEDFEDAIEFYNDGYKFIDEPIWFENAHKYFTSSIKKYERNYLAHLYLAHIYHYQENFRDFKKALEHYELCYTYAKADPNSNAITAQGYFYAGWLKASVFNDIPSAIKLTQEALKYDSNLSEAHYHLAKFYSLLSDSKNALKHLEIAIVNFDKNYTIKAKIDSDFETIESDLDSFLTKLTNKTYNQAKNEWIKIKNKIDSYKIAIEDYNKLQPYIENIQQSLQERKTYFNSLAMLPIIKELNELFATLKLDQRDKIVNDILSILPKNKNDLELFKELKVFKEKVTKPLTLSDALSLYKKLENYIYAFKTKEMKEIAIFNGHSYGVTSVAFSPNEDKIASGSYDHTVRIWDLNTKKEIAIFDGHSHWVNSVAFSPSGDKIVSGSLDQTVRVWDLNTKKEIAIFDGHSSVVKSVAFSPSGDKIVSGSLDQTVRVWDLNTKKEIAIFDGHSDYVDSVAFSPNEDKIASGSYDQTVRVWDLNTKKEIAIFDGHSSVVTSVAFSPSSDEIASGSSDDTVRVWDLNTKKEIAIFDGHSDSVYSVAFSPSGDKIVSGSNSSSICLLQRIIDANDLKLLINKKIALAKKQERLKKEQLKKQLEQIERRKKEEIKRDRIKKGLCTVCEKKLGFFDKLFGKTECKKHR